MINLKVEGMHCKSCIMIIEDSLNDIGAKNIKVSLDEKKKIGSVLCEFSDRNKIVKAIEAEGYKVN